MHVHQLREPLRAGSKKFAKGFTFAIVDIEVTTACGLELSQDSTAADKAVLAGLEALSDDTGTSSLNDQLEWRIPLLSALSSAWQQRLRGARGVLFLASAGAANPESCRLAGRAALLP